MQATIYINRHILQANKKSGTDYPAISINTYKGTIYAKKIRFTDCAELIQDASNARCSGATIWATAKFESLIIDGVMADRSMLDR